MRGLYTRRGRNDSLSDRLTARVTEIVRAPLSAKNAKRRRLNWTDGARSRAEGKWWWSTEPNPRPRSSPESVRKPTVAILDHSADLADIRQIGMTANLA
jgi:hypothetical protein